MRTNGRSWRRTTDGANFRCRRALERHQVAPPVSPLIVYSSALYCSVVYVLPGLWSLIPHRRHAVTQHESFPGRPRGRRARQDNGESAWQGETPRRKISGSSLTSPRSARRGAGARSAHAGPCRARVQSRPVSRRVRRLPGTQAPLRRRSVRGRRSTQGASIWRRPAWRRPVRWRSARRRGLPADARLRVPDAAVPAQAPQYQEPRHPPARRSAKNLAPRSRSRSTRRKRPRPGPNPTTTRTSPRAGAAAAMRPEEEEQAGRRRRAGC